MTRHKIAETPIERIFRKSRIAGWPR